MLRFPEFEVLGLGLAAMTQIADGDFARPGGRPESDVWTLAGLRPRPTITLRQVHGTDVRIVGPDPLAPSEEGDGLATQSRTLAIAVRVADCVPIFLFDPVARTIAILHAGRQGTYDGIAKAGIETLRGCFNTVPADIHALIGPSAGPCCYKVSDAIAAQFRDRGYPTEGRNLDLWQANVQQLVSTGVPPRQIAVSGLCTICGGGFHSYRATGTTARNIAVIAL